MKLQYQLVRVKQGWLSRLIRKRETQFLGYNWRMVDNGRVLHNEPVNWSGKFTTYRGRRVRLHYGRWRDNLTDDVPL